MRCNLQRRVGCAVVEETCGHEEIAVEGLGGEKHLKYCNPSYRRV